MSILVTPDETLGIIRFAIFSLASCLFVHLSVDLIHLKSLTTSTLCNFTVTRMPAGHLGGLSAFKGPVRNQPLMSVR